MTRPAMTKEEACQILYRLQLHPKRPGFFYTAQAVLLVSSLPDGTDFQERTLYRKIAALYRVSEESVEHDLHAARHNAWRKNREFLSQIAGKKLSRVPSVLDFLRILASAHPLL